MKCKLCKINEATVPDRNKQGSRKKEICGRCHANRLKSDLVSTYMSPKYSRGFRFGK